MKAVYLLAVIVACFLPSATSEGGSRVSTQATYGSAFDEVVVDTSLNIRHKASAARRPRDFYVGVPLVENSRTKRQINRRRGGNGAAGGQFGSSASSANAAAQSQFARPGAFGGSAASAQAQGFQSNGPLGSFGASAAGTQTQSFTAGRQGIQGSAGASGSQTYNLPNGKTVSVTFSNAAGQSVAVS